MTEVARGAYGLALPSTLADHPALRYLAAPVGRLDLVEGRVSEPVVEPGHVSLRLADGSHLDAYDDGEGRYRAILSGGPHRTADDLVHPYLAPIAALVHRWRGVPALHAAVVGTTSGAVALMGARGQGKTTTTAAMVERFDATLLSDDLLIVDSGKALLGPACIDLRPEGADLLGLTGTRVRQDERVRRLEASLPSDADAHLRLIVHLEFADEISVDAVPTSRRVVALSEQLYWPSIGRVAPDLLELTALPQVVLRRPRGMPGLLGGIEALLAHLSQAGRVGA